MIGGKNLKSLRAKICYSSVTEWFSWTNHAIDAIPTVEGTLATELFVDGKERKIFFS